MPNPERCHGRPALEGGAQEGMSPDIPIVDIPRFFHQAKLALEKKNKVIVIVQDSYGVGVHVAGKSLTNKTAHHSSVTPPGPHGPEITAVQGPMALSRADQRMVTSLECQAVFHRSI